MESLGKAGNIKIPASVPKRISEIGSAMKSISQFDIDRMESMSRALQGMQGLQNVRIPQVNTGGTGSGTPNPADISSEPATSGKSTTHSSNQTESMDNTGNGMSHTNSQLQEVTRSAMTAKEAVSSLKNELLDFKGITGISYVKDQLSGLKQQLSEAPTKITQTIGKLSQMTQEFKKSGGILGAFGRKIKSVATGLGSKLAAGMKQVTSALGSATKNMISSFGNKMISPIKNGTKALGGFLSSLKRIALYRAVRFAISQLTQGIKDGINNLYNYSALMGGTFTNSMNSLATNAQYLKNSMDTLAYKVRAGLTGGSQDSIADGVREGMYDANARQNELIKELITEVRRIGDKDFTTEITTSSITKALNRKNQRDGKTIIPVTT